MQLLYLHYGPQSGVTAAVARALATEGIEVALANPMERFLWQLRPGSKIPNPRPAAIRAFVEAVRLHGKCWKEYWVHTPWAFDHLTSVAGEVVRRVRPDAVLQAGVLFGPGRAPDRPYHLYVDHTRAIAERYEPAPGLPPALPPDPAWRAREEWVYRGAATIFSMSEFAARSLVSDYGVEPARVRVVGAGPNVTPRSGTVATRRPRDGGAPAILFVGRNFVPKGGPDVLDAFRLVRRAHPRAELWIVSQAAPSPLPDGATRDGLADPAGGPHGRGRARASRRAVRLGARGRPDALRSRRRPQRAGAAEPCRDGGSRRMRSGGRGPGSRARGDPLRTALGPARGAAHRLGRRGNLGRLDPDARASAARRTPRGRRARARRPDGARAGAPARVVRDLQAGVARVADARARAADGAHPEPLLLRAARAAGPRSLRRADGLDPRRARPRRRVPRARGARLPRAPVPEPRARRAPRLGRRVHRALRRRSAARRRVERRRPDPGRRGRAARDRAPPERRPRRRRAHRGDRPRRARRHDARDRRARARGARPARARPRAHRLRGAPPAPDHVRAPFRSRLPPHRPAAAVPPVRRVRGGERGRVRRLQRRHLPAPRRGRALHARLGAPADRPRRVGRRRPLAGGARPLPRSGAPALLRLPPARRAPRRRRADAHRARLLARLPLRRPALPALGRADRARRVPARWGHASARAEPVHARPLRRKARLDRAARARRPRRRGPARRVRRLGRRGGARARGDAAPHRGAVRGAPRARPARPRDRPTGRGDALRDAPGVDGGARDPRAAPPAPRRCRWLLRPRVPRPLLGPRLAPRRLDRPLPRGRPRAARDARDRRSPRARHRGTPPGGVDERQRPEPRLGRVDGARRRPRARNALPPHPRARRRVRRDPLLPARVRFARRPPARAGAAARGRVRRVARRGPASRRRAVPPPARARSRVARRRRLRRARHRRVLRPARARGRPRGPPPGGALRARARRHRAPSRAEARRVRGRGARPRVRGEADRARRGARGRALPRAARGDAQRRSARGARRRRRGRGAPRDRRALPGPLPRGSRRRRDRGRRCAQPPPRAHPPRRGARGRSVGARPRARGGGGARALAPLARARRPRPLRGDR